MSDTPSLNILGATFLWERVDVPAKKDKNGQPVKHKDGTVSEPTFYYRPVLDATNVGTFVGKLVEFAELREKGSGNKVIVKFFEKAFKNATEDTIDENGESDDNDYLNDLTAVGKQSVDYDALLMDISKTIASLTPYVITSNDPAEVSAKVAAQIKDFGSEDEFARQWAAVSRRQADYFIARAKHDEQVSARLAKARATKAAKEAAAAVPAAA